MNLNNNLINDQEKNLIPDIFPEYFFLRDIFPMEPPHSMPFYLYLATQNSQLEHLSLDVNTQSLRIEVERAKRQKMRSMINQLKQELSNSCSEIVSLNKEVSTIFRGLRERRRRRKIGKLKFRFLQPQYSQTQSLFDTVRFQLTLTIGITL